MNIRQSVIGEVATHISLREMEVDIGAVVRRLLLFDNVIVKSSVLREVPILTKFFGNTGLLDLVNSGYLKFSCQFSSIACDFYRDGVRSLPLNQFSFGIASASPSDHERMLKRGLIGLQGIPGLKTPDRRLIEDTLVPSVLLPEKGFYEQLMAQIESDLRTNAPYLKRTVVEQMNKKGVPAFDPQSILIDIEEVSTRVFHFRSNLDKVGLTNADTHQIFNNAISAVSHLNHRLADMRSFGAITGFRDEEAPLLFGKLAGIISPQNPARIEEQFERVIEITGLPDMPRNQKVDVKKLLEVRNSPELVEFREWLSTTNALSDTEITKMVSGVRNKLSRIMSNPAGKVARFAATTAISLIPDINPLMPIAAAAIDSFLVDYLLPKSGISAFITDTYPSLFKSA